MCTKLNAEYICCYILILCLWLIFLGAQIYEHLPFYPYIFLLIFIYDCTYFDRPIWLRYCHKNYLITCLLLIEFSILLFTAIFYSYFLVNLKLHYTLSLLLGIVSWIIISVTKIIRLISTYSQLSIFVENNYNQTTCSICYRNWSINPAITNEEKLTCVVPCRHWFDSNCIDDYLSHNNFSIQDNFLYNEDPNATLLCPYCRKDILAVYSISSRFLEIQ